MITNYEYLTHFDEKFKGKTFEQLIDGGSRIAVSKNGNVVNCPTSLCSDCKFHFCPCCDDSRKEYLNSAYKDQDIRVKIKLAGGTLITGRLVGFSKDDNPIIEHVDDNISYYYTSADYELVVYEYAELKERIKKAKTDDKIIVYGRNRYFSAYTEENGKMRVYYFIDGTTSFSNTSTIRASILEDSFDNLSFVED